MKAITSPELHAQLHTAFHRAEVEGYFGKKFQPYKELPPWRFEDYLGWGQQGDGKLFYGVYVQVVSS